MTPRPHDDPLHVLLASSETAFRERVRARLEAAGLWVKSVATAEEFARESAARTSALALVDAREAPGLEWCRAVPRARELPLLPLVALVGGAGSQAARLAGATDCAAPESDAETLLDRAHSAIAQHAAQLELARLRLAQEGGGAAAGSEVQPSLPDHDHFVERLGQMLVKAQPPHDQIAVLSVRMDLERALAIAPQARAFILACSAQRIRHCIRDRDTLGALAAQASEVSLARLDEVHFALLLPGLLRPHDAYKVARRLHEALVTPIAFENQELDFGCSIGIAVSPHDGAVPLALLQSAQGAERLARTSGHGEVRFVTPAMSATAAERLTLETSLRRAVEQRELCVFYQPKIAIASGRITGFEALVRWKHPELGMVSPAQFIPLAEETGLIVPLSEFVLEEACRQTRAWQLAGLAPGRMAVNLSGVHFRAPNLVEVVRDTLARTGLDAQSLELELTESFLLHKAESTIARLKALKALGLQLAIDDFGTGYSSLSYLKRFPIDTLKIDQSFVRDVTTDAEDAAITTSIILMGKSLKLKIVAEGVETESQLSFLRVLECDEAQGYLFSRPVPPEEAQRLLERQQRSAA